MRGASFLTSFHLRQARSDDRKQPQWSPFWLWPRLNFEIKLTLVRRQVEL